jgi:ABC-2 type transport system ATP-binding protein
MPIVSLSSVSKEYRRHRRYEGAFGALRTLVSREYIVRNAVEDISFSIEAGEAVGYVGPNGAGKSTTIKMLTGILVPTSGAITVDGRIPHENRRENAKILGAVFGQRSQLWWDLPVTDSFELHQHIHAVPDADFRRTLGFCREVLELDSFLDSPVRQLSLGQRMRAEMAMALLHEPKILFLDEPTIGLDVLAKDRIREFLRTINRERGVTIILTTHDLTDIEEICPRLIMINQGRVMFDDSVARLKATVGEERELTVHFEDNPGEIKLDNVVCVRDEGARKVFRFSPGMTPVVQLLNQLDSAYRIVDVAIEEIAIEDVIRKLYLETSGETFESGSESGSRHRAVVQ